MHRELLRLAALLGADDDGTPRWVARSRAVSTAYYALFHALADCCGRELVGARRRSEPFRHIYRSLDHGQARRVFAALRSDSLSSEAAKEIAESFIFLQDERHRADYDPSYRASGIEVLAVVVRAQRAITLLDDLASSDRKLVAARLIGRTRG